MLHQATCMPYLIMTPCLGWCYSSRGLLQLSSSLIKYISFKQLQSYFIFTYSFVFCSLVFSKYIYSGTTGPKKSKAHCKSSWCKIWRLFISGFQTIFFFFQLLYQTSAHSPPDGCGHCKVDPDPKCVSQAKWLTV